jgi:hypothetical protein
MAAGCILRVDRPGPRPSQLCDSLHESAENLASSVLHRDYVAVR